MLTKIILSVNRNSKLNLAMSVNYVTMGEDLRIMSKLYGVTKYQNQNRLNLLFSLMKFDQ